MTKLSVLLALVAVVAAASLHEAGFATDDLATELLAERGGPVVLTGTASQSTTSSGGVAGRGVDGNINQRYASGSCTHTDGGASQWWQLTLKSRATVAKVEVWNRVDCCETRLNGAAVSVDGSECGKLTSSKSKQVVTCNKAGTKVKITNSVARNPLTLCEVKVWGATGTVNKATPTRPAPPVQRSNKPMACWSRFARKRKQRTHGSWTAHVDSCRKCPGQQTSFQCKAHCRGLATCYQAGCNGCLECTCTDDICLMNGEGNCQAAFRHEIGDEGEADQAWLRLKGLDTAQPYQTASGACAMVRYGAYTSAGGRRIRNQNPDFKLIKDPPSGAFLNVPTNKLFFRPPIQHGANAAKSDTSMLVPGTDENRKICGKKVHTIQLASAHCNHNFEGATFGSSLSVPKKQAQALGLKVDQKVWFAKSDSTHVTGPYIVTSIADKNEFLGQHNSAGACQKIPELVRNDKSRQNPNIKLLSITVRGLEFTQEYPTGQILGGGYNPALGLKPLTYGINDYMMLQPMCTNIAGRIQPGCTSSCASWCSGHDKPWNTKCLHFERCQGCQPCQEGEFAKCPVLCRLRADPWAKKCKYFPICAKCPDCSPGAQEELQQIDRKGSSGTTGSLQVGSKSGKDSAQLAWQGSTAVHEGQCLCTCERPKCFDGKSTASSFVNYLQNSHSGGLCPHFTPKMWRGLQKCCEKKLQRFEKYVQSRCLVTATQWANRCKNVPDGNAIQIPNDGTIRNISPNACVAAHWGNFAVAGVVHAHGVSSPTSASVQLGERAYAESDKIPEQDKIFTGNAMDRAVEVQLGDAFGGGSYC